MGIRKQQELYQTPNKIEELESIRGLAAFVVVFFHIPKWNPILDIGIINNGYLMVELFFVLSGFVIFTAYTDKIQTQKDLLRFQFLRFGRLYPVHIIFLFFYLFIELSKYIAQIKFGISSPNSIPFKDNNTESFLKNIFLIQSTLPNQLLTFNFPSWSISVEFYTYLVFGVSILFFRERQILVFSFLAITSLVMLGTETTFGFETMLRCFSGFFVGCLTANVIRNCKIVLPNYLSSIVFTVIILFISLKSSKNYDFLIYFLTAALIASLTLSQHSFIKRILNFKALTWLGAISYSVYMSHAATEWAVNQLFRVVLKRPELIGADGKSTPQLSITDTFIGCFLVISIVLIISTIINKYVEKPLREKSRRFAFAKLS